MKPSTQEWVTKAEEDFAIMEREARVRKNPSYNGVCFHAQQCAEKYLKARLCEAELSFSKKHNLLILLDRAVSVEPLWETFREHLAYLTIFAVDFRYPGDSADKIQALEARKLCRAFRKMARLALGLESQ